MAPSETEFDTPVLQGFLNKVETVSLNTIHSLKLSTSALKKASVTVIPKTSPCPGGDGPCPRERSDWCESVS